MSSFLAKSNDSEKWKHCISIYKIGSHFIWWWKTKENMSVFVFTYTESLVANCRLVLPDKNFLWNSKFYTFIFWLIIRMGMFDFFSFELMPASSFFLSQRFDHSVCLRCLSIWITFGKFRTERFDGGRLFSFRCPCLVLICYCSPSFRWVQINSTRSRDWTNK